MKILCSHCELEMRPYLNGVNVIEYAAFGPYKLWMADEWQCPMCLRKVVIGFSDKPLRHYEPGFEKELAEVIDSPENLRRDFENFEQREVYRGNMPRSDLN